MNSHDSDPLAEVLTASMSRGKPEKADAVADPLRDEAIPLLRRIERNTRGIYAGVKRSAKGATGIVQAAPRAEARAEAMQRTRPGSSPRLEGWGGTAAQRGSTVPVVKAVRADGPGPSTAFRQTRDGRGRFASGPVQYLSGERPAVPQAQASGAQDQAKANARLADAVEAATPTKSEKALAERREARKDEEGRRGFMDTFKASLAGWDGGVLGEGGGKAAGATDLAGTAAGGPFWAAVQEMKEAAENISEGKHVEDGSLTGRVKQGLADATGITSLKDRAAGLQERARAKVTAWASGGEATAEQNRKGGKDRDGKGRYLSGSAQALANMRGKGAKGDAKAQAKAATVQVQTSDNSPGLLDMAWDLFTGGGKKGGGVPGKGVPGKGGFWSRAKGFGKGLLGVGAGALGLGGLTTGGFLGEAAGALAGSGGGAAAGAGEGAVMAAGGASKGLGFLGKAGKFLGKAAGPLAALMAVPSLVDAAQSGDTGKMGEAGGGLAGGLGGGAIGAAIGTALLPGIGTAVGGILGGVAGDWLGGKTGRGIAGLFGGGEGDEAKVLAKSVDDLNKTMQDKNLDLENPAGAKIQPGGIWGTASSLADEAAFQARRLGRAVTGQKVEALNAGEGLGGLSAQYESGGKGSEAVGYDSTGGTSYGKYQIATRTGTMDEFMAFAKKNNPEAYERLKAAGPADAGKGGRFAQEWQAMAQDGTLGTTEHDFIKSAHFDKSREGLSDSARAMVDNSKTLQDVLWSTSVQHGGAGGAGIFNKVYREGMSEQELSDAVYKERGTRAGSSTPQVQAAVRNRLVQENAQSQAMLAQEKGTAPASATALAEATPRAVPEPPRPPAPENAQALAEKNSAADARQLASLEAAAAKLESAADKLSQVQGQDEKRGPEREAHPSIPVDFQDTNLTLMDYDAA